jgi:hypothetical protein
MKTYRHKHFLGGLIFLAVFALVGFLVMLLWNALLPAIVGVTSITYLQSLGIIVLSRLLFGGLGHWGKHTMGHFAMEHSGKKDFWEMHHKFRGMSHQERAELIRERMCCDPEDGEK